MHLSIKCGPGRAAEPRGGPELRKKTLSRFILKIQAVQSLCRSIVVKTSHVPQCTNLIFTVYPLELLERARVPSPHRLARIRFVGLTPSRSGMPFSTPRQNRGSRLAGRAHLSCRDLVAPLDPFWTGGAAQAISFFFPAGLRDAAFLPTSFLRPIASLRGTFPSPF